MEKLKVKKLSINYSHSYDIVAIAEVVIFDIYRTGNISNGDVVLDLGAGIGEYSVTASRKVGREGTVISIEPNPDDFKILTENLKENDCSNVIAINKAFSETAGKMILEFQGKSFSADTISSSELMRILRQKGIDGMDVVKMDIEGAEVRAIGTLRDYLDSVRSISMELHGTRKTIDGLLNPLGFSFKETERRDYLASALFFFLTHPISSWNFLRLFRSSRQNFRIRDLVGEKELYNSRNLQVGSYIRQS